MLRVYKIPLILVWQRGVYGQLIQLERGCVLSLRKGVFSFVRSSNNNRLKNLCCCTTVSTIGAGKAPPSRPRSLLNSSVSVTAIRGGEKPCVTKQTVLYRQLESGLHTERSLEWSACRSLPLTAKCVFSSVVLEPFREHNGTLCFSCTLLGSSDGRVHEWGRLVNTCCQATSTVDIPDQLYGPVTEGYPMIRGSPILLPWTSWRWRFTPEWWSNPLCCHSRLVVLFEHDNARQIIPNSIHCAFRDVNVLPCPTRLPDFSPIKHVRGMIWCHLRAHPQPGTTIDDLTI